MQISLPAILGAGSLIIAFSSAALTATYERGHGALQIWDDNAMVAAPLPLQIWLIVMVASFAAGLLFIRRHPLVRWVVGGFVLSLLTIMLGLPVLGLTPLSGLVALTHLVFWSPGLYLLLKHRPFAGARSAFSVWSAIVTLVILVSLISNLNSYKTLFTNGQLRS